MGSSVQVVNRTQVVGLRDERLISVAITQCGVFGNRLTSTHGRGRRSSATPGPSGAIAAPRADCGVGSRAVAGKCQLIHVNLVTSHHVKVKRSVRRSVLFAAIEMC